MPEKVLAQDELIEELTALLRQQQTVILQESVEAAIADLNIALPDRVGAVRTIQKEFDLREENFYEGLMKKFSDLEDYSFSRVKVAARYGVGVSDLTPEFWQARQKEMEEEEAKFLAEIEAKNGFKLVPMTEDEAQEVENFVANVKQEFRKKSEQEWTASEADEQELNAELNRLSGKDEKNGSKFVPDAQRKEYIEERIRLMATRQKNI